MKRTTKKRPRTAQQKAQGAQMRIAVRLACCAYIVYYVIVPLISNPPGEDEINPTFRIAILIAFILAVAGITVFTALEIYRGWKAGIFKASGYKDDVVNQESGTGNSESGKSSDDNE